MKIGILAPPWLPVPPVAYGGTETVLDTLARGIQSAGHEVVLFTTGDSDCPVPRAWHYESAVGVGRATMMAEINHVIAGYEELESCDIVHDHTIAGPIYSQFDRSVPVVTTNHGPFESDLYDLYRVIGRKVPVIAISRHQASTAREIKISAVIHHGIDTEAFPFGLGDGGYAFFLGRMNEDKGVHIAVEAARKAGVPLLIAAKMREPMEREYFEAKVRPLLGDGIEYIGEVGPAEKKELLGKAVCLVNPINWPEPFGMVMIEAAACGTPVVASPLGSAPEIVAVGKSGFLAEGPDQLAKAILNSAELNRKDCRRHVEENFSATLMVKRHLDFYLNVLQAGSPKAA